MKIDLSLKEYLFSKIITFCFIAMNLIFLYFVMYFIGAGTGFILFTCGGIFLLCLAGVFIDFYVKRRRLSILYDKLDGLQDKYLAGELLNTPSGYIEKEYFCIMKEVSQSAIAEVERTRREKQEYCDYVESWIHEIKTPLTACSLILSNDGDVRKLKREIKKADNQTENILYYARLRTSEKDIIIMSIQIREIIDCALRNEMELLIAAKISVDVVGDFTVNTDSKQLEFILKQLFINSAKYCAGCRIQITAADGVLRVEDNGPGIPAHELPRVTQRGFTGERWRTGKGSTGMGLYIVSELCKKLSIEFEIASEQGRFTRFTFRF